MPLIQGYSRSSISKNIAAEIDAGRPQKQAEAIAYRTAVDVFKKRHPGKSLPAYLRKTAARKRNPVKIPKMNLRTVRKIIRENEFPNEPLLSKKELAQYKKLEKELEAKQRKPATKRKANSRKVSNKPTDHFIQATDRKTGAKYYFTGTGWDKDVMEAARWHDSAQALKIAREIVNLRGARKIVDTSRYQVEIVTDPVKRRGKNPVPLARNTKIERASRLYRDFTGHIPENVDEFIIEPTDVALLVGECDGILYTTVRDGTTESYIHKFKKRSRPLLAASHDGKQLILLGGAFQFTDRGIVDK